MQQRRDPKHFDRPEEETDNQPKFWEMSLLGLNGDRLALIQRNHLKDSQCQD